MFKKLRKRYCICNMKKGLFAREGKCIFCELFIETDKILAEKVEEMKKKLSFVMNNSDYTEDDLMNEIDKIFKSEGRK